MAFKSITEAPIEAGMPVLVRVDWNIPFSSNKVSDEYRVKRTLPTLEYLMEKKARVIVISHIDSKEGDSLETVFEGLKDLLPIKFSKEITGLEVDKAIEETKDGELLLLENLRKNPGEKENDPDFARALARYGKIFINEAFAASHRAHASIVGVPQYLPSYAGLNFREEVDTLSKVFYPKHPFLFILGGAKFDTKIPLITKFLNIADNIFVGGALAHNFFKEMGQEIGDSLFSPGDFHLKSVLDSGKIHLPQDMLVRRDGKVHIETLGDIVPGDFILDAGPNTVLALKEMIDKSSVILWNGPLGFYEDGYRQYTLELAKDLAASGKETIIGGADTLSAIRELGLDEKFSFVSTGGGAMLDFLSSGTLPGIEALAKSSL